MPIFNFEDVPPEAFKVSDLAKSLFKDALLAIYLFGSAVVGGLRKQSDIDMMLVIDRPLSEDERKVFRDELMAISGKIGNEAATRELDITVVNQAAIVPWQYPPQKEFAYSEGLRAEYENGLAPGLMTDPDLAIDLKQVSDFGITLFGPEAEAVLEPVPMADIYRATRDTLPYLLFNIEADGSNALLTLARMWVTVTIDEIFPKDVAAAWAITRLPGPYGSLLKTASQIYRGEITDNLEGRDEEVQALAVYLRAKIEEKLKQKQLL